MQQALVVVIGVAVLLLISNVLLAVSVINARSHEQMFIVPNHITAPFKLGQLHVDSRYLTQMSLAFLNARLNVTPATVKASHKWLLQFITPATYHQLAAVLAQETQNIQQGEVSSVFFISTYRIHPDNLSVSVQGELQQWIGQKAMPPESKTYQLFYQWSGGQLQIVRFTDMTTQQPTGAKK